MPGFGSLLAQLKEDMDIFFNYQIDGQCQSCTKIGAVNNQHICKKCNDTDATRSTPVRMNNG